MRDGCQMGNTLLFDKQGHKLAKMTRCIYQGVQLAFSILFFFFRSIIFTILHSLLCLLIVFACGLVAMISSLVIQWHQLTSIAHILSGFVPKYVLHSTAVIACSCRM